MNQLPSTKLKLLVANEYALAFRFRQLTSLDEQGKTEIVGLT